MAGHLIILLPLAGAFCLCIGVVAGHWLRGSAVSPGYAQMKKDNRSLMAERQGRERQMEHVSSVLSDVLSDPTDWRRKVQGLQKWMTERPPGE